MPAARASKPVSFEKSPTPAEVVAARRKAGLTQTEAGAVVHTTCRVWQQWEAGDREMHRAFWELFNIKALGT